MGLALASPGGAVFAISVNHEERTTPLKADRDDPDVTVEDRSTAQAGISLRRHRAVDSPAVIRRSVDVRE